MTAKLPIITVTCYRDLKLLELQAQSINLYLDKDCPVWIVVNEHDTVSWFDQFNKTIRHYYRDHTLTILTLNDFEGEWNHWVPSPVNPWAVGWETQQVLKLAVAIHLSSTGYLILDSQNFLIKPWDPNSFDIAPGKIPYRHCDFYSMPMETWEQYSEQLDIKPGHPLTYGMAITTPMFLHTDLVKGLINNKGGVRTFSKWFKYATRLKSEFVLYVLWMIKHDAFDRCHQLIEDYAQPYLRDCNTEEQFEPFIDFVGGHEPHSWVSINHRAWGNMTGNQYQRLLEKLETYKLFPKFDEYRSTYIDLKF